MTLTKSGSHIPENGISTTPRTNAAVIASGFQAVPFGFQDFARILETELAAMQARAEKAEAECVEWRRLLHMSRDDREQDLEAELAAIKKVTK